LAGKPLILASSSPFRRQLLERLALPFSVGVPHIDESALPGESPRKLVLRLAESKARALMTAHPSALIIGSDQVAVLGNQILGKPGNRANAIEQLTACNGKTVVFHTGLCLLDAVNDVCQTDDVLFEVKFRNLTAAQIERYVDAEQPFNSAGSFKAESLGVTLFEYLRGDDPSALIGLPLIRLTAMLNNAGVVLP
jgi:septum formation protein